MAFEIIIILCSLILSAFFSGMEIAYVSANKIHVEIEKKQNDFLAKILTRLTRKPSKFIATMLVGNNIALVIYGFFMGDLLMAWLTPDNFSNEIVVYLLTDLSLSLKPLFPHLLFCLLRNFYPKCSSRSTPISF